MVLIKSNTAEKIEKNLILKIHNDILNDIKNVLNLILKEKRKDQIVILAELKIILEKIEKFKKDIPKDSPLIFLEEYIKAQGESFSKINNIAYHLNLFIKKLVIYIKTL